MTRQASSVLDSTILIPAIGNAFKKLDPRVGKTTHAQDERNGERECMAGKHEERLIDKSAGDGLWTKIFCPRRILRPCLADQLDERAAEESLRAG